MRVFLYGSLANIEIQHILFKRELSCQPYILKNYCVYENSNTHEYYISPVDFGFIRGDIAEISDDERIQIDAFIPEYSPVLNEDSILLYTRQHADKDEEVPWGRLERVVCDMTWLCDKAKNRVVSLVPKRIDSRASSNFNQVVAKYMAVHNST
jgi:hypothetical protein